jgi:hypothetical protein
MMEYTLESVEYSGASVSAQEYSLVELTSFAPGE